MKTIIYSLHGKEEEFVFDGKIKFESISLPTREAIPCVMVYNSQGERRIIGVESILYIVPTSQL